ALCQISVLTVVFYCCVRPMPPGRDYAQVLVPLFRRTPVALLDQLRRALKTTSRTTVFRALTAVGYLTSYSHAGRYYTLKRIPAFDVRGLWVFRDVRFSVHGTLRATVERMVKQAPAGHTHEELQAILGLRVHDPLRGLVAPGASPGRKSARGTFTWTWSPRGRRPNWL
ncbi:MAG: hypothetical protein HW381_2076, partial [Candidatus Rokubacteria bacterium]|nr:hypothetical protein [Candidatus Rokubacteria bacterium]